jgi:hypothetical protein
MTLVYRVLVRNLFRDGRRALASNNSQALSETPTIYYRLSSPFWDAGLCSNFWPLPN